MVIIIIVSLLPCSSPFELSSPKSIMLSSFEFCRSSPSESERFVASLSSGATDELVAAVLLLFVSSSSLKLRVSRNE